MREPVLQVAEGAVYYYFSKYGDGSFTGSPHALAR